MRLAVYQKYEEKSAAAMILKTEMMALQAPRGLVTDDNDIHALLAAVISNIVYEMGSKNVGRLSTSRGSVIFVGYNQK